MFKNFIFQLAVCIFGCLIAYRMLGRAEAMLLFPKQRKRFLFHVFVLLLFILTIVLPFKLFLFFCGFLFFSPIFFMWLIELVRRSHFEKAAIEVLDLTVLRMKSGLSFRLALQESVASLSFNLRFYFVELLSHLEVEKADAWTIFGTCEQDFLKIILNVNRSSTRQIEKLMGFRANEKLKNHFRLKSRQMTVQVRIQAFVLLIFYFSLAVFQLIRQPQMISQMYFWLSIGAVTIGSTLLFLLPRSYRWKV